jgi:hypothetical protein
MAIRFLKEARTDTWRLLTEEERAEMVPAAVVERPRFVSLALRQDIEAPRIGETVRLSMTVVDLEQLEGPSLRGRAKADVELVASLSDSLGITHQADVVRDNQGSYHADFAVERAGRHVWGVSTVGANAQLAFHARPA